MGATDLAVGHFEIVDTGARIAETYECVRTEITQIFSDGFESGDLAAWSGVP
jgi:hypothetical protein